MQTYVACLQYIQSYVYSRVTAKKGTTMLDKELLNNLKAAQKADNQEKFVNLCYTTNIENTSVNGNFHGLGVVMSVITENNSAFIDNLYKCVADDEKNFVLVTMLDSLNDEGKFKPYFAEANDLALDLYCTYEEDLDSMLIWDNAEKIIEDLEDYLSINAE